MPNLKRVSEWSKKRKQRIKQGSLKIHLKRTKSELYSRYNDTKNLDEILENMTEGAGMGHTENSIKHFKLFGN